MVEYTCNNCLKKFINKTDFSRHLNRKYPCKKILNINNGHDVITIPNSDKNSNNDSQRIITESQRITNKLEINKIVKHQCNYCDKLFSTNSNLRRHERLYCKVIKQNKLNDTILLKNKIKKLENKINNIIKNNNRQIIKTNNNNSYNTNNLSAKNSFNTINNIVKFGEEDLSISQLMFTRRL